MKKIAFALTTVAAIATATPAFAAATVTSVAANSSNHLAVAGATANMTFDQQAGTAAEANSKGLTATFTGQRGSRTVVSPDGTTPYGVYALTPNPYDGNGYYAIGGAGPDGIQSSLALASATGMGFSSISVFIGSLDAYNTVQLLNAAGQAVETFTGTDMAGGAALPHPGDTSAPRNRRVTFTAAGSDAYFGIKFYNRDNLSAFEFDNVSFTAAVPEPATWAMMMLGFAMVGGAARYRRRSANVRFA